MFSSSQILLPIILILPNILSAMDGAEKAVTAQRQEQISRFPACFFFLGMRTEISATLTAFSKNVLRQVISSMPQKMAVEFCNSCATLVAAEACLLNKAVNDWTVEDLQKINGLLTHGFDPADNVHVDDFKPGLLRQHGMLLNKRHVFDHEWRSLPLTEQLALQAIQRKMLTYGNTQEVTDYLTKEELALFDKHYVRISPNSKVPAQMHEYLQAIKKMWQESADIFMIAAYAHNRLTKIHPFDGCNGRSARLIANILLMKAGKTPFIINEPKVYQDAVSEGDTDLNKLARVFEKYSEQTKVRFQGQHVDFDGVSTMLQPTPQIEIKQAYDAIAFDDPGYVEKLVLLKNLCLISLSLKPTVEKQQPYCSSCKITENVAKLSRCGGCKMMLYCSKECQKKHWREGHKNTCAGKAKP